jgi:hypothetical protein
MELVDRYVEAVRAELPRGMRADVGRELASLLAESVDERTAGGAPLRQAQIEVLRDFGSPGDAAARYAGPRRALIGHGMLPALWRTLAIVLAVLGGLSLVAWLWQAGGEADPAAALARALPEIFTQFLSNALEVAGLVLLIFAAVEWLGLRGRREATAWDPAVLESAPSQGDRVNRWGALAAAAALLFLLVWILFFRDTLGAVVSSGGDTGVRIPLAGPGLLAALPWLVAAWSAELVVQLVLLVRGRWSVGWRLVDLAASLFGLAVLGLLLASREPLLAITAAEAATAGAGPQLADRLATELLPLLDGLLRLALLAALAGSVIGVVRRVRRLGARRSPGLPPPPRRPARPD